MFQDYIMAFCYQARIVTAWLFRNTRRKSASMLISVLLLCLGTSVLYSYSPRFILSASRANDDVELNCSGFEFPINDSYLRAFRPATEAKEGCLLLKTIQALDWALRAANIPYFLFGGSLIGSWRHHGLVPWDDDADISVDATRLEDLRHALDSLRPRRFFYEERTRVSWKFYSDAGQEIFSFDWKWPFVDVCFFQQNSTHVWERESEMFPEYVYPKDWVFPTKPRPFNGLQLSAPRQTKKVLELTYNLTQCAIGPHSHRLERPKKVSEMATVHCDILKSVYPFVRHVPLGQMACNESVLVNGVVVSWLLVDRSPQCS